MANGISQIRKLVVEGYQDVFGIPHVKQQATDSPVEPIKHTPPVKELQVGLNLSKRNLPTGQAWRMDSVFGRVVNFFEQSVFILQKFWPNRPTKIDQRLMASIHGDRVSALYPGLQSAPLKQVLEYTLNFLKKQKKDLTPPKEVLKALTNCAKISGQLDRIGTFTSHAKRAKHLTDLCKKISKSIESLKANETIILPGGWRAEGIEHSALYEIKKTASGTLTFRIISRDPSLHSQSLIGCAGREKIYPHTVFKDLKQEELANPAWLHALLRLQWPAGETPLKQQKEDFNRGNYFTEKLGAVLGMKQEGEIEPDFSSLAGLLSPFASRIEGPTNNLKDYAVPLNNSTAQNIWTYVDMARRHLNSPVGDVKRRKLQIQMESLFRFYGQTKKDLRRNQTNQVLLEEGIQNVSTLASLMHASNQLTESEVTFINTQCKVIGEAIDKARAPKTASSKANPFRLTSKLTSYPFNKSLTKVKSFDPRTLSFAKGVSSSSEKNAEALSGEALKVTLELPKPSIPTLDPASVVTTLKTTLESCQELKSKGQDYLLQESIKSILHLLPLDRIKERPHNPIPARYILEDSFWEKVSYKEFTGISEDLTKLCELLVESNEKTGCVDQESFLLLLKTNILQENLARLNYAETKLTGNIILVFSKSLYAFLTGVEKNQEYENITSKVRKNSLREKQLMEELSAYFKKDSDGCASESTNSWDMYLGDTSTSYMNVDGKNEKWEEHYVELPSAFFKKEPLHPQLVALEKQFDVIKKIWPFSAKDRSQLELSHVEEVRGRWQKRYQYACFRGVTAFFRLGPESDNPWYSRSSIIHTEEEIRDNPEKILRDMQAKLCMHSKSELSGLPPISKQDLADLLCVFSKKSLQEMLGLIKQKPYLLDFPDVRTMLEHLYSSSSPKLSELQQKVMRELYEIFKSQGNIPRTLFLTQMMHHFSKMDESYVFPDTTPLLREWAHMSLDPKKPEFTMRHTIWLHYLLSFENRSKLSGEELVEFLKGNAVLQMSPGDVFEYDPLMMASWNQFKEKLRAPLIELSKKPEAAAFITYTIEMICDQAGIPIPKENWNGTFPVYRAGEYEVDLMNGSLINVKGGWSKRSLPVEVRRSADVATALSGDKLETIVASFSQKDKEGYFAFSDYQGRPTCLVSGDIEPRIYKEVEVPLQNQKKEKIWLQFVSKDSLFPQRNAKNESLNHSQLQVIIAQLLLNAYRKNKVENAPKLPGFLDLPQFRFWVDANQPSRTFILDEENTPIFQIIFKETRRGRVIESLIDLREGQASKKKTVGELTEKMHPIWQELVKLDTPKNVMVWKEGKKIEKVELTRYQLSFVEKEGKAVCCDPRLNGWILDNGASARLIQKGIPTAVVLRHPTIASQYRIIVPNKTIKPNGGTPEFNFGMIYKIIKSLITGKVIKTQQKDAVAKNWTLETNPTKQDFWIFDADPASLALTEQTQTSIKPYLYLAKLSLISHQPERALEFLSRMSIFKDKMEKVDFDELREFLELPATPDGTALQLFASILGNKLFSGKQKNDLEAHTVRLYKQYLQISHKITGTLRLDSFNERFCRVKLFKQDPEFANAHIPLLINPTEKRSMEVQQVHKPFIVAQPKVSNKVSEVTEKLMDHLRLTPSETGYTFSSKNLRQLGMHFLQMYKIASSEDVNSQAFTELKYSLHSLPTHFSIEEEDNKEIIKADFFGILQNYLTRVIEIHQRNSSIPFPEASEFTRYLSIRDRKFSFAERDAADKKNKENLSTFLTNLDKLIEEEEKKLPEEKATSPVVLNASCDREKFEKDSQAAIKKVLEGNPTRLYDFYPIEQLEEVLKTQKADAQQIELDPSLNQALCKHDELKAFFKENPNRETIPELDLSDLKASPKQALSEAAHEHEAEINEAKKIRAQKKEMEFINGQASRKSLEAHLETMRKSFQEKQAEARQAINTLLEEKQTPAYRLHQNAKLVKAVELETLLKHFLQNDLQKLADDLPKDISFDKLKTALATYLLVSTDFQRFDAAWEEVKLLSETKEGLSPIAVSNLYQALTDVRQYDPSKSPHLLLFEYMTNFLLRADQLQMVQDFLADPDCVRQAGTGVGKTTVILFLIGLMQANGTNLVTLMFPKHLYEDNLNDFQKKFGKIADKAVYALRFNMSTPTVVPDEENEGQFISVFKKMHRDFLRVVLEKRVVVSTLESQQALEQKWIRLMESMEQTPFNQISEMDKEHLEYLTKILDFNATNGYAILDEHDKALNKREERHLRIGEEKPVPEFLWQTTLDIYELLLANTALGLRRNIQGKLLSDDQRADILKDTALKIAVQWASDLNISNGDRANFLKHFMNYILGKSEAIFEQNMFNIRSLPPEELDKITALKDQFFTFLPITLSRTCNVRYIRSKDNIHTVPCLAGDIPKDNSEFEQLLERFNYMAQDHYQAGEKEAFIGQWIQNLKNQAEANVSNELYETIEATPEAQVFEKYFPDHKLGAILPSQIPDLAKEVNKDPKRIRAFLELIMQKMTMADGRISGDGYNLVSMFSHTCGTSATLGSIHTLPASMNGKNASKLGTVGTMIQEALRKSKAEDGSLKPVMRYNPEFPKEIIPKAFEQNPDFQIFIDGAGVAAMHGLPPGYASQQLLDNQSKDGPIKGVIIGIEGSCQKVHTRKGIVLPEIAGLKPAELGGYYDECGARGSDFKTAPKAKAVITVQKDQTLPDMVQTIGRLRRPDQTFTNMAPINDPIQNTADALKHGLINSVEAESDELYRGLKQEFRDIVRKEMLEELRELGRTGDLQEMLRRYAEFRNSDELIKKNQVDYNIPGSYFNANWRINKVEKNAVEELKILRDRKLAMARGLGLKKATSRLEKYDFSPEVIKRLPEKVASVSTPLLDQQVDVETDTQVETENQVDATVENNNNKKFPKWLNDYDDGFAIHALSQINKAFSPLIKCTENFIPLNRKARDLPIQVHRNAHDPIQSPVHGIQIAFKNDKLNPGSNKLIEALLLDTLDYHKASEIRNTSYSYHTNYVKYDLRLRKFVEGQTSVKEFPEELKPQLAGLLAQIRFFNGEFNQYPPGEAEALKEWLKQNNPKQMEAYFKNVVLKHRSEDKQKYTHSPLCKLFKELTA